ncbi:MAG: hypothetical protein Q8S00_10130 [Deltaproteobacteria bacterium]|nr:hypothetical protein [Deltaproteobacteria bacterium]MDZ4345632.1 hypothetical protein [Candidatus Binatia bacterium]
MNRQWPALRIFEPVRVIAVALLLPFLFHSADAQTLEKTRLGVSDVSFTFLPHLIAKDTGIFQKRGL